MICIAEGTLQAQLDGELTPSESLAVKRHLAECTDCRHRAEEVTTRCERVHELVYELSPLPSEIQTDPFLALARFKERLATEANKGEQATMHTLTPIQQLDGHMVSPNGHRASHNGHRPSAKVEAATLDSQASFTPAPYATLSFVIPESGNLITRLIATTRQFVRDFGRQSPRWRPNDAGELHFLLVDESFLARFKRELIAAAQEFKRDPRGFLAAAFIVRAEGGMPRRRPMMQAGAAMAVMAYAFVFTGLVIAGLVRSRSYDAAKSEELVIAERVFAIKATPDPTAKGKGEKEPTRGSKAKPQSSGGGGGGGRKENTPSSIGNLPMASLTPQLVMPNPVPPKNDHPSLPVQMTVYADPNALPKFKGGPIGLPNGVEGPPSSGPGEGAGIGNGKGTGVGIGRGPGVGPGENGNTGGGPPRIGGNGGEVLEAGKNGTGKPTILSKERAKYTEEARLNKVQGTVVLNAIFTADGRILNIRVVRGLPDGLNETAIQAAQRIRFLPATRNGVAVTVSATIEFSFAIY